MAKQGSNGVADGHQQSIAGDTDAPVDAIRGSHAGGIEPAGADVNAGDEQHLLREQGNAQQSGRANRQDAREAEHTDGPDLPGGEAGGVGVQGPGGMHQRSRP
jgi:hypothetical protein